MKHIGAHRSTHDALRASERPIHDSAQPPTGDRAEHLTSMAYRKIAYIPKINTK